MAVRAVQTAKRLLDLDEPEIGLLDYLASPHSAIGVSPAVALMGRQLATSTPRWGHPILRSTCQNDVQYKRCYDRRHGVRKLPPLQNGEPVLLKLDGEKQ